MAMLLTAGLLAGALVSLLTRPRARERAAPVVVESAV